MERRCFCVFTVLLLKVVLGVCHESSEETPKEVLGEEFAQIFYSLPTLFEYLLEILHERPEILEKDDVTFFQDLPQETCEGDEKTKREVDAQCGIQAKSLKLKDNLDVFKRNIVTNEMSKEIHTSDVNVDTMGKIITTKLKTKSISDNGSNDKVAKNKSKSKTEKSESKSKRNNNDKRKSEINTKVKHKVEVKKNVNFDDSFLGTIDWSKFYLTPDEVEEQAVKTERAIEEHNKKKGK